MRILGLALAFTLAACSSGGGGSDSEGSMVSTGTDCVLIMSQITLQSGQSCSLSQADADLFSTSAGNISCDNGTITYNGNTFSSGANGFSFNGLTLLCNT